MITYVNSKDAKLFELAADDLRKAGIEVGDLDLEQYLSKLEKLFKISPKYVRLPLYEEGHKDEEVFEIDANTRTIKIPTSFNKNGIGVVSDEFAEILWFKINRYFDIKDFGKASDSEILDDGDLHILIQWEAPDGAKGASYAFAIDSETDPEYIYFGWAITAEHLTAKAGNIRFAIRIMQYNESKEISYSFATQAAAVAVKANLSFDLTDEGVVIEEVADKITNRLMGGQIAYAPIFAEGGDLDPYILNLENGSTELSVVANAPEGGYDAMAYKWYKKGLEDDDFVLIDPEDDRFEGQYTPALTVTASGEYYVVVFGMRELLDGEEIIYENGAPSEEPVKFKYHTSVASSKSTVCEIPAPIKLEILPNEEGAYMVRKFVIGKDDDVVILVARQKIGENVVGDVTLKIEKTANAEKDLDLETAEFTVVGEPVDGGEGAPEYWIYDGEPYMTEAEAKAAADEDQGAEAGEGDYSEITHQDAVPASEGTPGVSYSVVDGVITLDMSKAEEGYYKFTVINTLNGDHEDTLAFNTLPGGGVEPVENATCRVVKPAKVDAAVATLLTAGGNPSDASEGSVSRENKIRADVTIEGLSDEKLIQWYKVVDEQDPEGTNPEDDILIEGATEEIYQPDDDGFFYYMVINKVEDTEDLKRSNIIKFAL